MHRVGSTWLLASVWWLAYALVNAGHMVGMGTLMDDYIDMTEAVHISLIGTLPWIPISIALRSLVRRFPLERGRLLRGLAVLGAAVLVVIVLRGAYVALLNPVLHFWYPAPPSPAVLFEGSVRNNLVLCCMLIGVLHAWVYADRAQEHRVLIADLEAGLVQARLDALTAQLNPHFLFNALNSIAELTHRDPHAAERMLLSLAALLRRSLSSTMQQEVRLAEELDLLRHYLSIEQTRLGERLQVRWQIAPDSLDTRVPALLLQPLVENAIVHGIARLRRGGIVEITAATHAQHLDLSVVSDGGAEEAATPGAGIGLSNTRARLRCLYGESWSLELKNDVEGRTRVQVRLPLRQASLATQAARETPMAAA
jgi:two-component system, LytTR family, sensor kinase